MAEKGKAYTDRKKTRLKTVEDSLGRLQPQALDLEEAVLGALLIDSNAFAEVCEVLEPESFYDKRNQWVYAAIRTLALKQQPVDTLTVMEELKKMGKYEEAGGQPYVVQLSRKMVSTAHLKYHAQIIRQKYLARQLISFASKVEDLAFDDAQDVEELLQMAESDLFKLAQKNEKSDFTQIDPIINAIGEQLRAAAARQDGIPGIASGYTELDKITSGWQNGDLVILAARPAMGKTAFALSMAKNMAIDNGIPVGFFSLEMSRMQLGMRLLSNVSEIPGEKLKTGQLAPYEWQQLDAGMAKFFGKPLYIDETPSLTIFEFQTKARRLVREHGVKVIMIDYLQLMDAGDSRIGNRQEAVSMISRSLKQMAKELNIPILALSQVNREGSKREGDEGKRPQLTDLRESGAIEQDADLVIFIHRPEYYHLGGEEKRGLAEIIIAKHRNGATGIVELKFIHSFAAFRNITDSIIESSHNGGDAELSASSDVSGMPDVPLSDDPLAGIVPSGSAQDSEPPF